MSWQEEWLAKNDVTMSCEQGTLIWPGSYMDWVSAERCNGQEMMWNGLHYG